MASTSIATVGEMVVVTQVFPKDEKSVPLQTPADAQLKAPPSAVKTPPPAKKNPAKVDDMTTAFLRGEPLSLGIVQICIGLVCFSFSVFAIFSPAMIVSAPFCFAAVFVISGSVAVAARRGTSIQLVWASLMSHVLSVLLGLTGAAYLCWLMAAQKVDNIICDPNEFWSLSDPYDMRTRCLEKVWFVDRTLYGLFGLLLVLVILQVCVAITVCVFSGKAIRLYRYYAPIKAEEGDCGALLDSDGEDICHPASP
ncbi:membrane-spanning 4-domains subfamily A member 4A [Acanthochromis polyacanthus]|uniref:membrane-spanning 4-domains subfamily A member 4A n=1 Tax=Acanthochromis polyacanthus TaxID=80966 RepID=UPI002234C885|nr:membrane-spanning 4-domains subfamily A member 4A [Acanthochromis polyacanthus]